VVSRDGSSSGGGALALTDATAGIRGRPETRSQRADRPPTGVRKRLGALRKGPFADGERATDRLALG
jgi:hypothetical protein